MPSRHLVAYIHTHTATKSIQTWTLAWSSKSHGHFFPDLLSDTWWENCDCVQPWETKFSYLWFLEQCDLEFLLPTAWQVHWWPLWLGKTWMARELSVLVPPYQRLGCAQNFVKVLPYFHIPAAIFFFLAFVTKIWFSCSCMSACARNSHTYTLETIAKKYVTKM